MRHVSDTLRRYYILIIAVIELLRQYIIYNVRGVINYIEIDGIIRPIRLRIVGLIGRRAFDVPFK